MRKLVLVATAIIVLCTATACATDMIKAFPAVILEPLQPYLSGVKNLTAPSSSPSEIPKAELVAVKIKNAPVPIQGIEKEPPPAQNYQTPDRKRHRLQHEALQNFKLAVDRATSELRKAQIQNADPVIAIQQFSTSLERARVKFNAALTAINALK